MFYLTEVALALEYLHARKIVYRDLKPENVMVDSAGHAKLVDFGFAKRLQGDRTATVCGTPGYLAPEQLDGMGMEQRLRSPAVEYGVEVDLWAFGILVFELLAGYNPFAGESPAESYENTRLAEINWPPYLNKVAKVPLHSSSGRNSLRSYW